MPVKRKTKKKDDGYVEKSGELFYSTWQENYYLINSSTLGSWKLVFNAGDLKRAKRLKDKYVTVLGNKKPGRIIEVNSIHGG